MEKEKLLNPGKPCFFLLTTDRKDFDILRSQLILLYKDAVFRLIRGTKSKTVSQFFDEVAAALQFPLYFGENWNAFKDCITDLEWIVGDAYILLVSDAASLLSEADSEDFRILIKMLSIANEEWLEPNKYIQRNRPVTPFHVVFQCSRQDTLIFSERLVDVGAEFETMHASMTQG